LSWGEACSKDLSGIDTTATVVGQNSVKTSDYKALYSRVNGDRLSKGRMAKFDPAQILNPSTN